MLTEYVLRGVKAGIAAGVAFGAYVALVARPLIGRAETFETGGHGGSPLLPEAVTAVVGVVGGVLWGLLLGAAVFGVAFYFLEPAIPGGRGTKSLLLAAAGFVTVSGGPWLLLPPQPPGVEQALSTETRVAWYLAMTVTGAVACGGAGAVYNQLRPRIGRPVAAVGGAVPFGLVLAVAALGPPAPVTGPVPAGLVDVFRAVTVAGQVGLWLVLAAVHAWLLARAEEGRTVGDPGPTADGTAGSGASRR